MSQTSSGMHKLFKPILLPDKTKKLLEHIVKGEQDKAEKMIRNYPELLLARAVVIDYSN